MREISEDVINAVVLVQISSNCILGVICHNLHNLLSLISIDDLSEEMYADLVVYLGSSGFMSFTVFVD